MAVFSEYSNHAATNSSNGQNIIPKHALRERHYQFRNANQSKTRRIPEIRQ
jgi:hypothetical protein